MEKKKIRLNKIQFLILYFFLFSFLGWLLETVFCFFKLGYYSKRGFLFGPLCPIYGFGGLMLIMFLHKYKKQDFKLFIYAGVIFSAFEYVVSYCLEALFAMHWWDYTGEFMNLNGRIGLFYFLAWGIISILFINHIFPFLKKKINLVLSKIPYMLQVSVLYLLCGTCFIDTVLSCIRYTI